MSVHIKKAIDLFIDLIECQEIVNTSDVVITPEGGWLTGNRNKTPSGYMSFIEDKWDELYSHIFQHFLIR